MAEAKHEFVDDYPYLVYAADNKAVYTASGDTPYIPGGGGGGDDKLHKIGTVTIATDTGGVSLIGAVFDNGDEMGYSTTSGMASDNTPSTFDVYCMEDEYSEDYAQGVIIWEAYTAAPITTVAKVTCTGDIEPMGETPNYLWLISGDGTITYSD